jgi:hypothetical protein
MAYGISDHDAVLKDHYTKEKVRDLSYFNNPFFGMVKKKKQGGRRYVQPVKLQRPHGGSAVLSTAITNQTKSRFEDFLLTRVKRYQVATVENEVMMASMEDEDAFLPAFDEFDEAFKTCGDVIAKQMFRTKGGSIGRIATTTTLAGADCILTDPADVFNFYIGQKCTSDTVDGGGTETDSGDTLEVIAIDVENYTVTFGENIDSVSGIAQGDFLFTQGDYGATMAGLESWMPVLNRATVLAADFYGVTRTAWGEKLGGVYYDGTGVQIDEVVIKLVTKVVKHGGMPNCIIANPETIGNLQLLWNGKRQLHEIEYRVSPTVGFPGFKCVVPGATGPITFHGDRNCPENRLYALQMDTWTLWHAGACPGFLLRSLGNSAYGGILLPGATTDDWQSRIGGYYNLGCSAPGFNGVAQLA